jgi:hypothetical protein
LIYVSAAIFIRLAVSAVKGSSMPATAGEMGERLAEVAGHHCLPALNWATFSAKLAQNAWACPRRQCGALSMRGR